MFGVRLVTGASARVSVRAHAGESLCVTPWAHRAVEAAQERVGRLVADDAQHFIAALVEEDDARRPEQVEALEQRLIVGVIRGDVGAQQVQLLQLACTRGSLKVNFSISLQLTHQSA